MANIPGKWWGAIAFTFFVITIFYLFLAMLPLSPSESWGNPFLVEMTAGSPKFPGLSSWARFFSLLIVWMPIMLYETLHTRERARQGDTVLWGIDAQKFVRRARWVAWLILLVHVMVNLWVLITGYGWGFIECFGALPNPLWCSPQTAQSYGVTLLFLFLTVWTAVLFALWTVAMFRGSRLATRKEQSLVGKKFQFRKQI